jgi:hypothetical protein
MPPDAPTLTDPALAGYSVDQLVRAFCDYTLTRPPGRWEYSNWDTSLLGHLLARRIGMDFEAGSLVIDRQARTAVVVLSNTGSRHESAGIGRPHPRPPRSGRRPRGELRGQ